MKEILTKLTHHRGVIGVMLYDGEKAVESVAEKPIAPETIQAIGRFLDRTETGDDLVGIFPKTMTFYFNDLILVSVRIRDHLTLTAVCERNINIPLLDISLRKTTSAVEKSKIAVNREKKAGVDDILTGPLSFPLERLQEMLSEYIGPVAKIIMGESIEKIAQKGPVRGNSLAALVNILAEEVDKKHRPEFLSRAKVILKKMVVR